MEKAEIEKTIEAFKALQAGKDINAMAVKARRVAATSAATGILRDLYRRDAFMPAYFLAREMLMGGSSDLEVRLLGVILAIVFDDQPMRDAVQQALIKTLPGLTADQYRQVQTFLLTWGSVRVAEASSRNDERAVRQFATFFVAVFPAWSGIFGSIVEAAPDQSPATARSGDKAASQPLRSRVRYAQTAPPSKPLKVLHFFRRATLMPGSRLHNLGERISDPMRALGWQVRDVPFASAYHWPSLEEGFTNLIGALSEDRYDLVIMDNYGIPDPGSRSSGVTDRLFGLCERVRALCGEKTKLVAYYPDPWERENWPSMLAVAPMIDKVWSVFPGQPLWDRPEFLDKIVLTLAPHGVDPASVREKKPREAIGFTGAVMPYTFTRAFWQVGLGQSALPVDFKANTLAVDGLSVRDSYREYLKGIASNRYGLSLAMRQTGERILTGRCFETMLAGSLLIQEETPDLDYFITRGEHYLAFRSVGELLELIEDISINPKPYHDIQASSIRLFDAEFRDDQILCVMAAAVLS